MKASYKLQLEQHQRRLGLTHKQLNKYDRKHNDINLINYLKSLNPVSAPPAGPTGFWGTFRVDNEKAYGNIPRHMHVSIGYNDTIIDGPHQINSDQFHIFTIPIEDRAPLPSSTIQLKVTFQSGVVEAADTNLTGFSATGWTGISLQEENTYSMLIDENNIDEGVCSMTWIVSTE